MLLCGELLETHPGSPESNGNRIRIVIEFLREYLTVKPQLEVLAQVTNLSKYYLIRRFTQHTGMPPVYPRWRREHAPGDRQPGYMHGLSPLARGTRKVWRIGYYCIRFIPAGAGNTAHQFSRRSRDAVYPRWRGEHISCRFLELPNTGLSPLARGTPGR